jgi:tetratricopeptide (TPR) repeat protein
MLDGMLHYKQSAYHEAIKCFDIYIDQYARLNIPWAYPDCLLLKGRSLLALYQNDDAYQTFQQAHAFAQEHECDRVMHEALLALSDAEIARGHTDNAYQYRIAALQSAQQMADGLADPEIRDAFLSLPDVHSLLTDMSLRGSQ